jgi:uncharacterized damage-inducible protein DinB
MVRNFRAIGPSNHAMRTLSLFLVAIAAFAQNGNIILPVEDFVKDWQISKQFTIDVADKMPAAFYDFKPTPAEMSFGQLMFHIAGANVFRFNQLTGAQPPASFRQPPPKQLSKEFALQALNDSFDYVIAVLPKITPEQMAKTFKVDWKGRPEPTGRAMMLNMFVHVAHHRAQAEVYMRLKGIEPPTYTF